MRSFLVAATRVDGSGVSIRSVKANSPEDAIDIEFGVIVKPASAFAFDYCTQESDENGYLYWLASGSTEASKLN